MQNLRDHHQQAEPRKRTSSRGSVGVIALCGVLGLVYLGIGLATDRVGFGIGGLVIMVIYGAALLLLRRRSESARLLSGDIADERQALVMQRASSFMGHVLLVAVLGGFLWSVAVQSESANIFSTLGAIGGISFALGVVVATRRT